MTASAPPPHPPSPRAQRAATTRPTVEERSRGPRIGYFRLHRRGDLRLTAELLGAARGQRISHESAVSVASVLQLTEVTMTEAEEAESARDQPGETQR